MTTVMTMAAASTRTTTTMGTVIWMACWVVRRPLDDSVEEVGVGAEEGVTERAGGKDGERAVPVHMKALMTQVVRTYIS